MEVLIMEIESTPALNERSRDNKHNIGKLTDILKKVVHIFMNANPKRNVSRFGQLNWQSFTKEVLISKYGIPIRKSNQIVPASAMVQPQEETKEGVERVSLLEETKEEIHVP